MERWAVTPESLPHPHSASASLSCDVLTSPTKYEGDRGAPATLPSTLAGCVAKEPTQQIRGWINSGAPRHSAPNLTPQRKLTAPVNTAFTAFLDRSLSKSETESPVTIYEGDQWGHHYPFDTPSLQVSPHPLTGGALSYRTAQDSGCAERPTDRRPTVGTYTYGLAGWSAARTFLRQQMAKLNPCRCNRPN